MYVQQYYVKQAPICEASICEAGSNMYDRLQHVGMMDSASGQAPAPTMFEAQILKISSALDLKCQM